MVEASLRLTYSIGLIAALAFLGFTPDPERRELGPDDPGEPDRARASSRGASSLPIVAIALLTIGTGLSATASRAPRPASTAARAAE